MSDFASGPAREAGPGDELAGILRDCADRVPGSLERLLARYDEHLRAHVGSTLAGAAVAGPALRAALTAAWAEAADFDPAREPAEAWLAARVRRARVAAGLIPFPARTDGRADGEPSDREAVPASPATALRPQELHLRLLGPQGDGGVAEPPRPAAPGGDGDDGEPGPAAPDGEVGNGTAAPRDGDAGREDAGARRAAPAEPAAAPPPAAEEVDYRWVANYQRAEIRSLEARVQDLERRLRLRTAALLGALALAGLGAAGGAYLALGPLVKPEPVQATRTAPGTGPGGQLSGTADPAATARVPGAEAGPEPAAAPPAPSAEVREAGPLPSPEAGPPPRAGERPAAPAPGVPAERTAPEELEAKDPAGAGAANGTTGSDPAEWRAPRAIPLRGRPRRSPRRTGRGSTEASRAPRPRRKRRPSARGTRPGHRHRRPLPGRRPSGGAARRARGRPRPRRRRREKVGGAAEGGTSGPSTPPSTAAEAGRSVPPPPTGDATSRRPAAAPPVPAAPPRGPPGGSDGRPAALGAGTPRPRRCGPPWRPPGGAWRGREPRPARARPRPGAGPGPGEAGGTASRVRHPIAEAAREGGWCRNGATNPGLRFPARPLPGPAPHGMLRGRLTRR